MCDFRGLGLDRGLTRANAIRPQSRMHARPVHLHPAWICLWVPLQPSENRQRACWTFLGDFLWVTMASIVRAALLMFPHLRAGLNYVDFSHRIATRDDEAGAGR